MTITLLIGDPDAQMTAALMCFEQEFSYPLGDRARFRITHDGDGWRFFNALGEAAYAVAHDETRVLGVLGAALRRVVCPDGSTVPMLYLGDLKISGAARSGRSLLRLAGAVQQRFHACTRVAYAVVMDGTGVLPPAYSGRLGIPAFVAVAEQSVLWIRTGATAVTAGPVANEVGQTCFADLAAGRYHMPHGDPTQRSLLSPRWLMSANGLACGRLEDTARSKRLCSTNGEDMRSAHFSCFAYRTLTDGLRLLDSALEEAAQDGYPMLFTAVDPFDAVHISQHLGGRLRSLAPATIFATGVPQGERWLISTADI